MIETTEEPQNNKKQTEARRSYSSFREYTGIVNVTSFNGYNSANRSRKCHVSIKLTDETSKNSEYDVNISFKILGVLEQGIIGDLLELAAKMINVNERS